jgi:uncharacterized membrane protein
MAADEIALPSDKTRAQESIWQRLKLPTYVPDKTPPRNPNDVHDSTLTPLERLACKITDAVGSMGFFLIILVWTVIWCGYNLVLTYFGIDDKHPHGNPIPLRPFDPFPAFVAYLLMSNVIQILLMPLIMVGQNLQGRHAEIRAQLDFEINQKAEKEVIVILRNLEHNTDLVIQLMKHLQCSITDEEIRALAAERDLAQKLETISVGDSESLPA